MALTTELNVEGNPKEKKFMDLVMAVKPAQVTLVPDNPNQLTSNHGWNTLSEKSFLQDIITQLKEAGIRSSIFVDPQMSMIEGALETGTDRIELYTESFAHYFAANPIEAIAPYLAAAQKANELGLGLNAGHDLSLENLRFFAQHIPSLLEVSIGHALVCDALYYGLENTVGMYKRCL
jgi:pyridoxine 5-phosphate synthase